jgi:RimJ/RimL family protein N-acetyltransferase
MAFQTKRLVLRQWKDSDLEPFYQMSSDPIVMKYFPSILSRSESDAFVRKVSGLIESRGWGFWALEEKATSEFIGFTGIHVPIAELPFSPCVEIGWRLRHSSWAKGFAFEAAEKVLGFSFQNLGLDEIVSYTSVGNLRSRKVMERIGMKMNGEFDHPALPPASHLRRHILFRISKVDWGSRLS